MKFPDCCRWEIGSAFYSRRTSIWANYSQPQQQQLRETHLPAWQANCKSLYSNQGYRASILERAGRRPIDRVVRDTTFSWPNQQHLWRKFPIGEINWGIMFIIQFNIDALDVNPTEIFSVLVWWRQQRSLSSSWGIFDEKSRGREPSESKPWNLLVMCNMCCALV